MTNSIRWLLRFWLLFSFCWLGVVGQVQQEELCAARLWPTSQERSDREAVLARNLASPGLSSEARKLIVADHERNVGPRPVHACLPSALSEETVQQTGGYSIDWDVRLPALALWLLALVIVFLLGFMMLWVAGAFSH